MCHFAVKIEDKCAIFNILFIGYITFVIFVMSDFLAAYVCGSMRVRIYSVFGLDLYLQVPALVEVGYLTFSHSSTIALGIG